MVDADWSDGIGCDGRAPLRPQSISARLDVMGDTSPSHNQSTLMKEMHSDAPVTASLSQRKRFTVPLIRLRLSDIASPLGPLAITFVGLLKSIWLPSSLGCHGPQLDFILTCSLVTCASEEAAEDDSPYWSQRLPGPCLL